MTVGKILYKQDRPLWINPDLTYKNDSNCAAGFGNPSGHAMFCSVLAFTVLFDLIQWTKRYDNKIVRIVLCVLFLILALTYSALMAISRVVLANQAWNQIVYGWLLGVWTAFFCHLVIRDKLDGFVEVHLLGISLGTLKKTGIALGLFTAFTAIQIGAYYIATLYSNRTDSEISVIVSNAKTICEDFNSDIAFNDKTFKDIGLSPLFFGAIIGVFLQAKAFDGQSKMQYPKEYAVLK